MGASAKRQGFAIIADVVASKGTEDFVQRRDWHLERLSRRHRERGWIESPYTVTAWDEFQTYSWQARAVPSAILELRQEFAPWALTSASGDKYRRLTRFRTGDEERDRLLDLVYGLHDSLAQEITERQWQTIGCALLETSQERIAARLSVRPSTVSRNLQRGRYWQMRETLEIVPELLVGRAS